MVNRFSAIALFRFVHLHVAILSGIFHSKRSKMIICHRHRIQSRPINANNHFLYAQHECRHIVTFRLRCTSYVHSQSVPTVVCHLRLSKLTGSIYCLSLSQVQHSALLRTTDRMHICTQSPTIANDRRCIESICHNDLDNCSINSFSFQFLCCGARVFSV